MSNAAFFYGTLISPDVQCRVLCGSSKKTPASILKLSSLRMRPAILKGHKRHALKDRSYPGIVATGNDQDSVRGILCEGLSPADVKRLDLYEGDEYKRDQVQVDPIDDKDAGSVSCQAYIWIEGNDQLENYDWDEDHFLKVKAASWSEDPEEFSEVDKLDIPQQQQQT
ncbi:hypothetical protein SNOG_11054 [Lichtheimia corymbifera JMRC:FSU:9682]|uniref:Putative gamma-glutamylcyclotransferase n=1 Tax=Lichtheimia corymbifera JMRC:FSU:9682 TaxID=1263082 RepID=A0A068RRG2_9FUNG|nr:hypothetical protein SNOG_11054 [Lichtheimia corymbifera JMRC:FSU:9682]